MSNSQILKYFTQGSDEMEEEDYWKSVNHPVYGVGKVRAGWVLNAWEDDNHNVVRFETKDAYYVVASGDDNAAEHTVIVAPLRPQDKDGATASVECVA